MKGGMLRPTHGSGEDRNTTVVNTGLDILALRPAYGSDEDRNWGSVKPEMEQVS